MTSISDFLMAKEIGRVPSSTVPLNAEEESRFAGLAQEAVMIDVHQHPFVLPEDRPDSSLRLPRSGEIRSRGPASPGKCRSGKKGRPWRKQNLFHGS